MRDPFSVHDEFYGDLDCHKGERRQALRLKVLETGRNVCFGGKGGGSAPSPDPQIGEAAKMNAETGQEWLNFAREQFEAGNIRQEQLDALSERIINQQMESNERANQWAAEDRLIQKDYRDKYDGWADQDRATGRQYLDDFADMGRQSQEKGSQFEDIFRATGKDALTKAGQYERAFQGIGDAAAAKGSEYEGRFRQMGSDALREGQRYRDTFDAQAKKQYQFGDEQLDRYRDTFAPIEQEYADKARNWDSQERLDKVAAEAKGDVIANARQQQDAQARNMQAMGIDPRSGKYQAIDRETGLNTALAAAGAQNAARDGARGQAMQLQASAIGMGHNVAGMGQQANQIGLGASQAGHSAYNQGQALNMQANTAANAAYNQGQALKMQAQSAANSAYNQGQALNMQANSAAHTAFNTGQQGSLQANNAGLAASGIGNTAATLGMGNQGAGYQGLGLGVNAGSAAMGTALGAQGNWYNNQNIMAQGYGGAMQGYQGQANILNNQYNSQLQAWSAQQQANAASSAGLFGAVGTGIGAYAAFASSEDSKTNKKPVKGALDAIKGMPVESWDYKKEDQAKGAPPGVIPPDDKRHIGTYAEDFRRETGLGDGKTLPIQDAIGVTMKAVQELDSKVEKLAGGKQTNKGKAKRRAA